MRTSSLPRSRGAAALNGPQFLFFPFRGGTDNELAPITTPAGHVIDSQNYESVVKGYHRVDGYERYDGRTRPSQVDYYALGYTVGNASLAAGTAITGATSGATATLCYASVVASGSFGGSDAAGTLVLVNVTGTFQAGENIQVSGVTKAHATGAQVQRGASNDTDDTTWQRAAIEYCRSLIQTVPGEGDLLGAWLYKGDRYAIRNNVGSTAAVLFKATSSGWAAQDLGRSLSFTAGGTHVIAEGDTITGATSGATALVKRVVTEGGTGSWAASSQTGRLILYSQTGTFQAESIKVGGTNCATIAGNSTANALAPSGRFDFVNHNFYGSSNKRRMYGCNGQGPAFEWDGAVFVPIVTGMATDHPKHIAVFKNQLILSFAGGSTQVSGVGDPYAWTILSGAAEIGIGDEITGYLEDVAGTLNIYGANTIKILTGDSPTNFVLTPFAEDSGAVEWTAQKIITPLFMDQRGVRKLTAVQATGGFQLGTITQPIEPLLLLKKALGVTAVASVRCRKKNHYRLFFSDGSGISIYLGAKVPECMPFLLPVTVKTICSGEDENGDEVLLFGSNDGYVYELDAGTSFDGAAVTAFLRTPFFHLGSPNQRKAWKKVRIEADCAPNTAIAVAADYDYGDPDTAAQGEVAFTLQGGGGIWNESLWDRFSWSTTYQGIAETFIDGIGRNMSVVLITSSIYDEPHTLTGMTVLFTYRGAAR